jgi:hypothetical protein
MPEITIAASGAWLANIRSVGEVLGAFGALFFGAVGAMAKLCEDDGQLWTVPAAQRQRVLWRGRARFRVLFRRLHYSRFHDVFFRVLDDSRAFLLRNFLAPSRVFSEPDNLEELPSIMIIIAVPILLSLTYAYYIQIDALLNTPDLVIPAALRQLASGAGPIIVKEGGLWSGRLITLIALPLFTLVPVGFSVVGGCAVIHFWHVFIVRRLPRLIWERYAPFSAIPQLVVFSFGLTALALMIGKFTSPAAPMPTSTRVFIVNTVFDAASVAAAWLLLRRTVGPPGSEGRTVRRAIQAIGQLCAVIAVTGALACLSLYLSLVGTENELPLQVAINTLIARPTAVDPDPVLARFSATSVIDPNLTNAEVLTRQDKEKLKSGDYENLRVFIDGSLIAYATGSFELLDAFEQKDGRNFAPEFRRQFNAAREVAAIRFYGRSGYGPYFWFMHTTMFPLLVISTAVLVYAVTLSARVLSATWLKYVSRQEKPYTYVAVRAGICATFCSGVAAACKYL